MAIMALRVGSFPHQMYVAGCDCIDGQEEKTCNYTGHVVGPPKCSKCKRSYRLVEELVQGQRLPGKTE